MPAPTRVGWIAGSNSGAATLTLSNPAGAAAGDRVVAFVSHTGSGATITNLQGWTLLSTVTFNTRRWHILERAYAASYPALTLSTGEGMLWAVTAFRPTTGFELGSTVVGSSWRRVDNGGSINTTQAPSITAAADALALAFFSETSTAAEAEAGATLSGAGWAKWFWSKAVAGDANPINFLAYRAMDAAGATGTPVLTYKSPADAAIPSNNGAGIQLLIPQTSTGPGATGNLDTTGVFQNSASSLTVGARQVTSGAVVAVLRLAGVEVGREAIAFVSGRGSALFTELAPGSAYDVVFEVDGVLQTDVAAAGSTLRTGASSFKAVTGSCMFTGSTHPIFDAIAAEAADFWTVQGDAHYEDQTTAAGWWSGMVTALNAWRGLARKVVTRWTPDNHDTIRTTPLGGGAPELPSIWKQLAGATGWASADSVGQAWQNGRVLFLQPDLRSARFNYQTDTGALQMLGAAQEAWFNGLLEQAEADPTVALVVWFDNWIGLQQGSGRWGSYPDAYARINNRIQASPWLKAHLVLIGGDSHNLWADSGARSWPEAAFPGIPSLNMSGYNRASPAETFYIPDIANATLIDSGAEADWGGYSRLTVTDDGTALTFLWEAVRVNAAGPSDVMASWSRTFVDAVSTGSAAQTLAAATATAVGATTLPRVQGVATSTTPAPASSALAVASPPAAGGEIDSRLLAVASVAAGVSAPPVQAGTVVTALLAPHTAASGTTSAPPSTTGTAVSTTPPVGTNVSGIAVPPSATASVTMALAPPSTAASATTATSDASTGSSVMTLPPITALALAMASPGQDEHPPQIVEARLPDPPGRAFDAEGEFLTLYGDANWE